MRTSTAAYAIMALSAISEKNPEDEIKVTQGSTCAGFTSLLVTDRYTRDDLTTHPTLLHRYQAIAESWGATAWVEWDKDHGHLVVIIG